MDTSNANSKSSEDIVFQERYVMLCHYQEFLKNDVTCLKEKWSKGTRIFLPETDAFERIERIVASEEWKNRLAYVQKSERWDVLREMLKQSEDCQIEVDILKSIYWDRFEKERHQNPISSAKRKPEINQSYRVYQSAHIAADKLFHDYCEKLNCNWRGVVGFGMNGLAYLLYSSVLVAPSYYRCAPESWILFAHEAAHHFLKENSEGESPTKKTIDQINSDLIDISCRYFHDLMSYNAIRELCDEMFADIVATFLCGDTFARALFRYSYLPSVIFNPRTFITEDLLSPYSIVSFRIHICELASRIAWGPSIDIALADELLAASSKKYVEHDYGLPIYHPAIRLMNLRKQINISGDRWKDKFEKYVKGLWSITRFVDQREKIDEKWLSLFGNNKDLTLYVTDFLRMGVDRNRIRQIATFAKRDVREGVRYHMMIKILDEQIIERVRDLVPIDFYGIEGKVCHRSNETDSKKTKNEGKINYSLDQKLKDVVAKIDNKRLFLNSILTKINNHQIVAKMSPSDLISLYWFDERSKVEDENTLLLSMLS